MAAERLLQSELHSGLLQSLRVATSIRPASRLTGGAAAPGHQVLPDHLALADLAGRLAELSGAAAGQLSIAVGLVQDAQRGGEPVAWIHSTAAPPYPPDLAQRDVDLEALVMVRVQNERAMLRAADQLLRSGAFGLVILDYLERPRAPLSVQVRLTGLCRQHECTLLCLGPEPAFPMASLRAHVDRRRSEVHVDRHESGHATGRADARSSGSRGRFVCSVQVEKDKRRGQAWRFEQCFDGPVGLS